MKHIKSNKVLFLILFLSLSFFGLFYITKGPSHLDRYSANTAFQSFADELFCREVSANTLMLHYTLKDPDAYGIPQSTISLGDYVAGSACQSRKTLTEDLTELRKIPYDALSPENKWTFDVCEAQLSAELSLASFGLYEEIFQPTLGIHAQLPILLAEYSFETLEDVDVYLELLSQLDSYYQSLLLFQQEKASAGLFMSDTTLDRVINQCHSLIQDPDHHFLISTFEERISKLPFVSASQKDAYLTSNTFYVKHHVIPAYVHLIQGLTAMRGQGKNTQGLYYYEHGREYYQALIAANIGSSRTVPEIKTLLEERIHTDTEVIRRLLHSNPDLIHATPASALAESSPEILSTHMLQTLEQRILTDFPEAPSVNYQVKKVHPSLEQHLSPAFYLNPPLDDTRNHTIYINNSADYDSLTLFTTLAHEGYPGHLYQSLWENSSSRNPVLSIFYFGGYTEGWATYAERMSYSYAEINPNLSALLAANNSITLGIYALADIGIHFEGWSLKQTQTFLSTFGIDSAFTAEQIYQAVLEAPANYLKYYLGYIEIEKLKEQASAALGETFHLIDFHTFLLSKGPAPFSVLEKYLKQWIQEQG